MNARSFLSIAAKGAAAFLAAAFLAIPSPLLSAGQARSAAKAKINASAVKAESSSQKRAEDLQVCVGEKCTGAVSSVYVKDRLFVDAAGALRLLGGQSISYKRGKLTAKLGGASIQAAAGSLAVVFGQKDAKLPLSPQERNGKLFVPVEFFTLQAFGAASGKSVEFNETAWSLDVAAGPQVGDLDYFSYGTMTRVSIDISGVESYKSSENGRLVEIRVPGASLDSPDRIAVKDGVVDSVSSAREGSSVVITIERAERGGAIKASMDEDSIDVEVAAVEKEPPQAISRPGAVAKVPAASGKTVSKQGKDSVDDSPAPQAKAVSKPAQEGSSTAKQPEAKLQLLDSVSIPKTGKVRVVIDAGHGGKDPGGSRRKGLPEKSLNLAMAKDLESFLKADGRFEVLMTRASDVFLSLDRRSQIANNWQADVFVSLHANANRHKRENGYEVYFMSENATDPWAAETAEFENSVRGMEDPQPESTAGFLLHNLARNEYMNEAAHLAGMVAKGMDRKTPIKNDGVKQAAFYVLRGTYSPAILVEMGYMTNASDVKNLNSPKVRKQMAKGIYEGIVNYAKSRGRIADKGKKNKGVTR